jgi:hypothetical protein
MKPHANAPLGPKGRAVMARRVLEDGLARGGEDAWLMPGRKAGTHLSAASLTRRLARYGISASAARHAALLELAARLPAPILAERFGLHQVRAAKWSGPMETPTPTTWPCGGNSAMQGFLARRALGT